MTRKIWSIINHLFGSLIFLVFLAYFGTSIASLVIHVNDLTWYGILFNVLVLIFEMIGPIYVIYFLVQLFDGIIQPKKIEFDLAKIENYPRVSVMIAVRNAHPKILEDTLAGFQKQTYPNFELWIGDDNSDEKYSKIYKELCEKYSANYFYGEKRGYKSGMLNKMYPKTNGQYIAIFDVDQIPAPQILDKFVAVLEQNPKYAFVQAKLEFRNVHNLLHAWEIISYYQLACAQSGKMVSNSVIWHGCNACFRREYAYPIPEGKLSEDFDHTINLLSKGQIGCFIKEIGCYTLPTETFDHKVSQMFRWTTGQVGAVIDHTKQFFKSKLTFKQSLDLFISSTLTLVLSSLYLVGIMYAIIYALKIPIYRALGLDAISMVIVPALIGLVYCLMISATTIYSIKNSQYKIGFFHIIFYLIFSSIAAPLLLIPTIKGLLRKNKLGPKASHWNEKIKMYLISTIYSIIGIIFVGLTLLTMFDNWGSFNWYPQKSYFFTMFLMISFMLIFSLPFIAAAKKNYKESPFFKDENVYI